MKRLVPPRLLVLLALVLAAPLTALAAQPAQPAQSAQSDDAKPIRIGGLFAESGPSAFVGTATRLVAELAFKEINESGGVLGRKLELVRLDDQSDPNAALRLARQLVEQEQVLAIIGPTRTDSGLAVKKYTEEKGVPTIMTVGGDPIIAGGKFGPYHWTFQAPQRSSTAVEKIYKHLKAKGLTRIAILTAKDGFGQDGKTHLTAMAARHDIEIVAEESMDAGEADFSAQTFKLLMAKPQAIVVWTIGPAGSIVTKNLAALPGDKPLLVQCHGQPGPKFVELAGKAAEGVIMPGTKLMAPDFLPDSDPQKPVLEKFIKSYRAAGLEEKFTLNTHSGYAYDATLLLAEALKKAGKAEPAALRDALESLTGVVGVSGVFSYTPEVHNGLDADSLMMLTVKDGKFVPAP